MSVPKPGPIATPPPTLPRRPLDFYGDTTPTVRMRLNMDHVVGTDGNLKPGVLGCTENSLFKFWFCEKTRIAITHNSRDTLLSVPDTSKRMDLTFRGEALQVDPVFLDTLPGYNNYYFPWTMPNGVTGVPATSTVIYRGIYPDIDLIFYSGSSGLKIAWLIHPGGDPDDIYLHFDGLDSLHVDWTGALRLYLQGELLRLDSAIAYQYDSGGTITQLTGGAQYLETSTDTTVKFVVDTYDTSKPLVLLLGAPPAPPAGGGPDPLNQLWSTYVGGNDADELTAIDVDAFGDAYTCGYTYDDHFPISTGYQVYTAAQSFQLGNEDAVVMRFRKSDKRIMWATYHGGSSDSIPVNFGYDKAYDIAVQPTADTTDYVFVTGTTACTDFPIENRSGTPFANAVHESNFGDRERAFISAYRKYDGRLDWSTTHGSVGSLPWKEEGLGVDVDADGTVVLCGKYWTQYPDSATNAYPYVLPSGAYHKANGGSFFILFDADYQIQWCTPFADICYYCWASDVKIGHNSAATPEKVAYVTGSSAVGTAPMDLVVPPLPFEFYQGTFGGGVTDAYLARFNLENYQLEGSTYWGGDGDDIGIGLTVVPQGTGEDDLWLVGGARSTDLTNVQLPTGGSFTDHDIANDGSMDGVVLHFRWANDGFNLVYGTLIGGVGPDYLFDVDGDPDQDANYTVYITGQSYSPDSIIKAYNPLLYQQTMINNVPPGATAGDGLILAIDGNSHTWKWTSYYGGWHNDKGWGVAATTDELYFCGGTDSHQSFFPLKEFDIGSPYDWYDADMSNNLGSGWSYISYNGKIFIELYTSISGFSPTWSPYQNDAWIASFAIAPNVSVPEVGSTLNGLLAVPIDGNGHWNLYLPDNGPWSIRVVDARGRLITLLGKVNGPQQPIDLSTCAPGIYAVVAQRNGEAPLTVKLPR